MTRSIFCGAILLLASLGAGCAELTPNKAGQNDKSTTQANACGISSCAEGSQLDPVACACVGSGSKDGENGQCMISACSSGFILEPQSCACTVGQTQKQTTESTRPVKGTVSLMSEENAPKGRRGHSVTWTGSTMLVWGGLTKAPNGSETPVGDGGSYDPKTDTWRTLSSVNAPSARAGHRAVWTGKYLAIIGKDVDVFPSNAVDGALYDPEADVWTPISGVNAPEARSYYTVTAVGSKIVVWGGSKAGPANTSLALSTGAVFDPEAGTWTPMSSNGAPMPPVVAMHGFDHGGRFVAFGGLDSPSYPKVVQFNHSYDLDGETWSPLSMQTGATYQVTSASPVVWTGEKLIHVSGIDQGNNLGLTYYLSQFDAASNEWTQKALGSSPSNVCSGDYHGFWTGRFIAQIDPACIFDVAAGLAYDLPPLPRGAAAGEALPEYVVNFDVRGERAVWTGEEILAFGGEYQASDPPANCPDGAPCIGPQNYSGVARGVRYLLGE